MYVVDIIVSITTSGNNTAGQNYSLLCSATVIGSTDLPTITWLDSMNNTVPSGMITTAGITSALTFNQLAASYAGTYTCSATVGGAVQNATEDVTVLGKYSSITLYICMSNVIILEHG